MPRKKKETPTSTNVFVMETTPSHLRHLGGDCLVNDGNPRNLDAAQAVNASPFSLFPGDIVNKFSPEAKFHFTTIEIEPDMRTAIALSTSGHSPVACNDWYYSERVKLVFRPTADGRVSVGGKELSTLVLWVQSKERMDATVKSNRKFTDDVSKSAEERMAETGQRLAWAGMTPTMVVETADTTGEVRARRETDFVTKGF